MWFFFSCAFLQMAIAGKTKASVILKHLHKLSPGQVPLSHVLYQGIRLKDKLEKIRNNWFHGEKAEVKLSRKQKQWCFRNLRWMKSYISSLRIKRQNKRAAKELEKRGTKRKSQYSASLFTSSHEKFKNDTSLLFANEVKRRARKDNWLVLDDFQNMVWMTLGRWMKLQDDTTVFLFDAKWNGKTKQMHLTLSLWNPNPDFQPPSFNVTMAGYRVV